MHVFVLDAERKPLDPCTPARARQLLSAHKAAVLRRFPFTLILKSSSPTAATHPLHLGIYPTRKATGMALRRGPILLAAFEITHRTGAIVDRMLSRRSLRRGRRHRKTRHRPPRFLNRVHGKKKGWLAPSLMSRVYNVMTWVRRLQSVCPLESLGLAVNKYDTQLLQKPELTGVEYSRGTLYGFEVRGYLLEKFHHKCAICADEEAPLQVTHAQLKAHGGSDRVSNLYLACPRCVEKRGARTLNAWLARKPELLARIQAQMKRPLREEAWVTATRWRMLAELERLGLPVSRHTSAAGQYHRWRLGLTRSPWACAVGVSDEVPDCLDSRLQSVLAVRCTGHGRRQRCRTDKYGVPVKHIKAGKYSHGYTTGDIATARVPGKPTITGRVTIREKPAFLVGKQGVHPKYLTRVHQSDGYDYAYKLP